MASSLKKAILHTEEETTNFAHQLALELQRGDIVLFLGDLGSGKTFVCREIIRFFCGDKTTVPSPTFNILQTYEAPELTLYHFDLYRLNSTEEAYELNLEEAFSDQSICLIEWPEIIKPLLPKKFITVKITLLEDGSRECRVDQSSCHKNLL